MKNLIFLLLILSTTCSLGQENTGLPENFNYKVYDQAEFDGRFALLAEEDVDYNYFVADFTRFTDVVERGIFVNLVFEDRKVISMDNDIHKDQFWIKAHVQYSSDDILCHLDDLKNETGERAKTMTEAQKQEWREKNMKLISN